ncbi:hypothetical protein [Bradyrhizobium sp. CER78]|uniref:hypothetical protein n=1 Tax=Bradyrhizobium sp. CER78 TaxID=3039162 RepID=UPI0024496AA6|nr:hypothetical protein [Bradyrhizobium sp. CER78]MDH2383865.1 hypothetical protein [Bradyrhizobium sp. CER78]
MTATNLPAPANLISAATMASRQDGVRSRDIVPSHLAEPDGAAVSDLSQYSSYQPGWTRNATTVCSMVSSGIFRAGMTQPLCNAMMIPDVFPKPGASVHGG